jgi:methylthioribose-1-phosphate isomerase
MAMAAHQAADRGEPLEASLARADARLRRTRPTAVNLFWALDRMARTAATASLEPPGRAERLRAEAEAILAEDLETSRRIGAAGLALLKGGTSVLTHCNAGGLATGGLGTALAPVYAARDKGLDVHVFADETRPLLQGARLTAWELSQSRIPVTLLCDGASASLLASGKVDLVIVGADRVVKNGDTANKIGTYTLALAAQAAGVPFYVAAPLSTFDLSIASGKDIPIEQRGGDEVTLTTSAGAPGGVGVYNPAFDVTPAGLIAGWITERGVLQLPFELTSGDSIEGRLEGAL